MAYETDQYARDARNLWLRVGRAIAKSAKSDAEKGNAEYAARKARIADYCHWQATGEGECPQWRDLFPAPTQGEA